MAQSERDASAQSLAEPSQHVVIKDEALEPTPTTSPSSATLPQGPAIKEESLDVILDLTMRRIEDCRHEGRAFGTKTGIILTADGVLLAIIANSFDKFEFWSAIFGVIAILSSAYLALSVLRTEMSVFGISDAWDDIEQTLNDPKFLKLMLVYRLRDLEKNNRSTLADMAIKWALAALALLIAIGLLGASLFIHNIDWSFLTSAFENVKFL